MTRKLENMTVRQLVDHYAELCIAQDEVDLTDQMEKFNGLFRQMRDVDMELRTRGKDARLVLLRLYDHPNLQVRLQAAKGTLGVAPVEARRVIEAISQSDRFPQAGEAGMTLEALDDGIFKPD